MLGTAIEQKPPRDRVVEACDRALRLPADHLWRCHFRSDLLAIKRSKTQFSWYAVFEWLLAYGDCRFVEDLETLGCVRRSEEVDFGVLAAVEPTQRCRDICRTFFGGDNTLGVRIVKRLASLDFNATNGRRDFASGWICFAVTEFPTLLLDPLIRRLLAGIDDRQLWLLTFSSSRKASRALKSEFEQGHELMTFGAWRLLLTYDLPACQRLIAGNIDSLSSRGLLETDGSNTDVRRLISEAAAIAGRDICATYKVMSKTPQTHGAFALKNARLTARQKFRQLLQLANNASRHLLSRDFDSAILVNSLLIIILYQGDQWESLSACSNVISALFGCLRDDFRSCVSVPDMIRLLKVSRSWCLTDSDYHDCVHEYLKNIDLKLPLACVATDAEARLVLNYLIDHLNSDPHHRNRAPCYAVIAVVVKNAIENDFLKDYELPVGRLRIANRGELQDWIWKYFGKNGPHELLDDRDFKRTNLMRLLCQNRSELRHNRHFLCRLETSVSWIEKIMYCLLFFFLFFFLVNLI